MRWSACGLVLVVAGAAATDPSGLSAQEATIPALHPTATSGVLDGDPAEVFGVIERAVLLPDGRAVALDPQSSRLRLIGADGRPIHEVGQRGRGPGDFFVPRALTHAGGNEVAVLDAGNLRLSFYRADASGLLLVQEMPLDIRSPQDLCWMSGYLYIAGSDDGALIHQYTREGERVRSFARPRLEGLAVLPYTSAHLLCVPEHSLVVLNPFLLAGLRAYTTSGALAWRSALPDFIEVDYRMNPDGSSVYSLPEGASGTHRVTTSVVLADGNLLVQTYFNAVGSRVSLHEATEVISHVIDSPSGQITAVTEDLPRLVDMRPGRALGVENLPYPRVVFYETAH